MNKNEEMVYSAMGLDPILFLETPPKPENYTVHIIRPGEEEKEEANEKTTKHIKNIDTNEKHTTNPEEVEKVRDQETNVDSDEKRNDLVSTDKILINEQSELNSSETKEADEDPRRKRRRSSASS